MEESLWLSRERQLCVPSGKPWFKVGGEGRYVVIVELLGMQTVNYGVQVKRFNIKFDSS